MDNQETMTPRSNHNQENTGLLKADGHVETTGDKGVVGGGGQGDLDIRWKAADK